MMRLVVLAVLLMMFRPSEKPTVALPLSATAPAMAIRSPLRAR